MVGAANEALKSNSGCSKAAILKYITNNFNVSDHKNRANPSLRLAMRRSLERGELKRLRVRGVVGSFNLAKKKVRLSGGKKNEEKIPNAPAKLCKTKGPGKGRRWKGKQKEEADKTGKESPSEELKVRASTLDVKRFSFTDV
ncbi:hypothetical protein V3C99_015499 [Haemonchus contortus]